MNSILTYFGKMYNDTKYSVKGIFGVKSWVKCLLAILSLYLCFAGDVFAEIVNQRTGNSYTNLYDAVSAASSNDVLTLTSDVDMHPTEFGNNNSNEKEIVVNKNLTIQGKYAIRRNSYRVYNSYSTRYNSYVSRVSIPSGYTLSLVDVVLDGASIDDDKVFLTIKGAMTGGAVRNVVNKSSNSSLIDIQYGTLKNCTISNCTIRGNNDADVVCLDNSKLVNCVVAENKKATNNNHPVAVRVSSDNCYVINCTVVNNTRGMNGIYSTKNRSSYVYNTIDYGNRTDGSDELYGLYVFYSCYEKGNVRSGSNNNNSVNPSLSADYSLTDNSTNCIDKGNDSYYTDATYGNLDIIGNPRKDGTIDIGAFEKIKGTTYYSNLTAKGNDGMVLSSQFTSTDRTLKRTEDLYSFVVNPVSTDNEKNATVVPIDARRTIIIDDVTYTFDHWEKPDKTVVTGNSLSFSKDKNNPTEYIAIYKSDRCAIISASKSTDLKWGESVRLRMESCDYVTGYLIQWQGSHDQSTWQNIVGEITTTYTINPYNKDSYRYYRMVITYKGSPCYSNVVELTPAPCGVSWEVVDAKGNELNQQFIVNPTLRSYVVEGETQYTVRLNAVNSTDVQITALNQRIPKEDGTSQRDNRVWNWPATSNSILDKVQNNAYTVKSADVTYEYEMKYKDCSGTIHTEHFIVRVDFSCKSKDSKEIWKDDFGTFNGRQYTYTSDNGEKKTITADVNGSGSSAKYAVRDQNGAVVNHNYFQNWDAQDGYYAIVKLGSDASNNFNQDKYYDRTSRDGTGGMLVVNFANTKEIPFYQRDIPARDCDGALVYLSCYIAGVQGGKNATSGGSYSDIANWSNSERIHEPNVKMEVWSLDGKGDESNLEVTFYSGDVPNPNHGKDDWVNLSAYFKMEKNVRYRMKLINNKNQQYGNDVRFDDISAVACYPNLEITDDPKSVDESKTGIVVCGTKADTVTLYATVGGDIKKYYDNPYYLYQYRKDENSQWIDFNKQDHSADSCRVAMLDVDPGVQMRAIVAKDKAMVDWVCLEYEKAKNTFSDPKDEAKRYPKVDCAHPYGYSYGFTIDYYPALDDLEAPEQYMCVDDQVNLSFDVPAQYTNIEWYDATEDYPEKLSPSEPSYSFIMKKPSYEHWLVVKNEDGVCPDTVVFVTKLNTSVSLNCLPDESINSSSNSCSAVYKGKPEVKSCVEDAMYTYYYAIDEGDYLDWDETTGVSIPLGEHTIHWKVNMTSEEYELNKNATCSQKITVTDATQPVISITDDQLSVEAERRGCGFYVPSLTDLVRDHSDDNCTSKTNLTITSDPSIDDGAEISKTTTITYTVTDEAGNSAEKIFTVSVPTTVSPLIYGILSNGNVEFKLPDYYKNVSNITYDETGTLSVDGLSVSGTVPFGTHKLTIHFKESDETCPATLVVVESKEPCNNPQP